MAYTTIDKPSDYFNTVTYTGTGSSLSISSLDFSPDLVWIKSRNHSGHNNNLIDAVREAPKILMSDNMAAEITDSTDALTAFTTNGFTLGANTAGFQSYELNNSGDTYVSWNWLAGGTASSNTDGDITSTVSANTVSGFSIVSYTGNGTGGATVGHGLGSAPAFYVIKQRDTTGGWIVYHKGNTSAPETDYLRLDKNDPTVDDAIFNDTAPTSSVFSIGTNAPVNTSSGTYVAYCFSEVKGFSKFGSYTGNGDADGTFVYTGFKPAFVLVKRTDTTGYEWSIWDNKRDSFNLADTTLRPNTSGSESTIGSNYQIDMLSQGFKFRTSNGDVNASGGTFIYMAFAENPFVTSGGIPTTAR